MAAFRIAARITLCLSVLMLSACISDPSKEAIPQTRDKAAAVLISVSSVTPWHNVSDALRPNFQLDAQGAYDKVAPVTARINEQLLRAFELSLTASPPGASAPTPSSGVPANAQIPAAASQPDAANMDMDPILKYQAALSLYQAVQLLNRQVDSIDSNGCYTAYLVQMKIAIMPYSENLPFDLHSRLSFFLEDTSAASAPVATSSGKQANSLAASDAEATTKPVDQMPAQCKDASKSPIVVPVLATDDIEKAILNKASMTAAQIVMALGGTLKGAGVGLQANKWIQASENALGQNFNSRFTVGRLVDNTLYVRVGASNQGGAYSLIGQTYDLALVLLVPKSYAKTGSKPIEIVENSEFRWHASGAMLQERSKEEFLAEAEKIFESMNMNRFLKDWRGLSNDKKMEIARTIAYPVSGGSFDFAQYKKILSKVQVKKCNSKEQVKNCNSVFSYLNPDGLDDNHILPRVAELWSAMSALLADSPFKTASFMLPGQPAIIIPDQVVVLSDDQKNKTTASIQVASGLGMMHALFPELTLYGADGHSHVLAATSVAIDPATQTATLTFPSLKNLGIPGFDPTGPHQSGMKLLISQCEAINAECPMVTNNSANEDKTNPPAPELEIIYSQSPNPGNTDKNSPSFAFSTNQYTAAVSDGKMDVTVQLGDLKGADAIVLSSDNAYIISAANESGKALTVKNGQLTYTADDLKKEKLALITLKLGGVRSGMVVDITAQAEKGNNKVGSANHIKLIAVAK